MPSRHSLLGAVYIGGLEDAMRYRRLGRTGYEISEIGHGLWGMGNWSGSDDQQSLAALQQAVELGCNFFDTAWAYGNGHSDRLLGHILSGNRGRRLYAASKIPPRNLKWPASGNDRLHDVFPRDHVIAYADRIREALGVTTIDLLQYHVWDDSWASEPEFAETVRELKESGRIGAFGLSLNRWEPENGLRAIATGLVDSVQVIYNIFDQAPEDKLFPACRQNNIGVIARVPLDEGGLTGTLSTETRFPEGDWRVRYFNPQNLEATVTRAEKLKAILPAGMTLPEMALRFILSHPAVSTTIVGMRKPQHVAQNLACSNLGPLPPELIARLREHRWERRPTGWSA